MYVKKLLKRQGNRHLTVRFKEVDILRSRTHDLTNQTLRDRYLAEIEGGNGT